MATLRRWLEQFDAPSLARHPSSAALAALGFAFVGEAMEADRWVGEAVLAARDQGDRTVVGVSGTSAASLVAVARAVTAPEGVDHMVHDATTTLDLEPDWSPWRAFALAVAGIGQMLIGDLVGAQRLLAEAAEVGERLAAHPARSIALAELAALAIDRGDWSAAETYATKARAIVVGAGLDDYPLTSFAYAVTARTSAHRGDLVRARTDLAHLARVVPSLTYAIPWLAIQTRVEMARVHLALGETDAARQLLAVIDAILERRPDVGDLRRRSIRSADRLPRRRSRHGSSRLPRRSCGSFRCCRLTCRSSRSPRSTSSRPTRSRRRRSRSTASSGRRRGAMPSREHASLACSSTSRFAFMRSG